MDWLRRVGRQPPPSGPEQDQIRTAAIETAVPGVAALLAGVPEDGSHAVLDLGSGTASSLALYSGYARYLRFADLLSRATAHRGRGPVDDLLDGIPSQPRQPYDLVFAWDILDRLFPEHHGTLVKRLVAVTAPGARLHVVMRASEQGPARPLQFTLLASDRMRYEPTGAAQPVVPRLLPAQVAHLLEPFHVVHGYTLKGGLREYVAIRQDA
jgi:trans-aconitate methyltransferase